MRIGIDVVDLGRMRRIADDYGPAAAGTLLAPDEHAALAGLDAAGRARAIGVAVGVKEAWLKAHGRRPPGWLFPHAHYVPGDQDAPSALLDAALADFAHDLGTPPAGTGRVTALPGAPAPAGTTAGWAWHAPYEHWLISAVVV
ncbi:4'-phosphopantetheinyl transferase superfamily protein [Streptomyces sp. NPDC037389]|uniref:4'-phosphopantetheinyl transferase family protein n=1 Tax=Streptomyces sp. NPDC037389 TaxID=3155369 RepID=UPI0033DDC0B7